MINLLDDLRKSKLLCEIEETGDIDWDYDNDDETHDFNITQSWRRDPDPYNLHKIPLDIRLASIMDWRLDYYL